MTDWLIGVWADLSGLQLLGLLLASTLCLWAVLVLFVNEVTYWRRAHAISAAVDRRIAEQAARAAAVRRTLGTEQARYLSEACEPSGDPDPIAVRVRR